MRLHKIRIVGEYTGENSRGIMVGGTSFKPKFVKRAFVSEDDFIMLMKVEKNNGWFKIHSHNYEMFLEENNRVIDRLEELEDKPEVPEEPETPVEPEPEPTEPEEPGTEEPGEVEVPGETEEEKEEEVEETEEETVTEDEELVKTMSAPKKEYTKEELDEIKTKAELQDIATELGIDFVTRDTMEDLKGKILGN